jgi:hypothetical protein
MQYYKKQLESILFYLSGALVIIAIYVAIVGEYPSRYPHPRKGGTMDILVLAIGAATALASGLTLRRLRRKDEDRDA